MLLRKLEAAEAAVRGMQGTLLSMADGAKAAAVAAGGGVPVIPGGAPAADLNAVPIAFYFATHSYFTLYHALASMVGSG